MMCSYCCKALPDDTVLDTLPNLSLENLGGDVILRLHGECVQEVVNGLLFGKKLLVH